MVKGLSKSEVEEVQTRKEVSEMDSSEQREMVKKLKRKEKPDEAAAD